MVIIFIQDYSVKQFSLTMTGERLTDYYFDFFKSIKKCFKNINKDCNTKINANLKVPG